MGRIPAERDAYRWGALFSCRSPSPSPTGPGVSCIHDSEKSACWWGGASGRSRPRFLEESGTGARQGVHGPSTSVSAAARAMDEPVSYAVLIDRISHEGCRTIAPTSKHAVLQGRQRSSTIRFMWTADDQVFFSRRNAGNQTGASRAPQKQSPLPPTRSTSPAIVHAERPAATSSIPLDWKRILDYIGLPCVLEGRPRRGLEKTSRSVHTRLDELFVHYNESGLLTMVLPGIHQVGPSTFPPACCLGQEEVLVMKYDPHPAPLSLSDEEHVRDRPRPADGCANSLALVRALGYDMNSVEWGRAATACPTPSTS